ncbi:DUF1800 domain-containing protein [Hellea balneolensis]|uniref:DUF1800 domain-containing protein n=1 Tax=Hellea balneolensis TaxID=287478 RepID=UPI00138AF171|nr:DUF1800 domain-containing protein [Hellea balneolensis]
MDSAQKAASFLSKTGFGGNADQIEFTQGKLPSKLLKAEFAKPPSYILPAMKASFEAGEEVDNRAHGSAFWNAMIEADDQLRQRMVFALSQIVVVSDNPMGNKPLTNAQYVDALYKHAFGNYKELLKEVTYTPAMARYLTYLRNRKGDERTGRMPDENYAREFLQLFTTGLVELNMDGTQKLSGGKAIEIFNNEDIVGLAKVFTGLSYKGTGFWDADDDGEYSRLVMFQDKHSPLEKSFMGKTISAGTAGDEAIDQAIDHIFEHPNLAPFISRQLIQRFTASHPDPAYVTRVANAFESGTYITVDETQFGTGERGDLQATLAAILLDEGLYGGRVQSPEEGKVREPVLRFVHWARAFDVGNVMADNEWYLLYNAGKNTRLGQQPFQSPSVFNFYRPGFVAPGTASGTAGLTAPELQIVNDGAAIGYANFMLNYVFNTSPTRNDAVDSFVPDYTDEAALADTPEALADHLNTLLLGGRMSSVTKTRIVDVLNEIPIRAELSEGEEDRTTRASLAVYMAVTSPAFALEL